MQQSISQNISTHLDQRGLLTVVNHSSIPFNPVRSFTVCAVPVGTIRGNHAHYACSQFLVVTSGMVQVDTNKGNNQVAGYKLKAGQSLYMEPLTWATQKFLLPGSSIIVYCSHLYDKDDYIKDMEKFQLHVRAAKRH